MTLDINVVIQNLNELLTNSVSFTDKFYDIFFNPTPMDVTLELYDENNVLQEVTIPNRAKDIQSIESSINTINNLKPIATTGNYDDLINRPVIPQVTYTFINVKDYGAVGDGVTDDTTAINEAFAAAMTLGGMVWFEPGKTYLISSNVVLGSASYASAIIFGNNATLKLSSTFRSTEVLRVACRNNIVLDINVDGSLMPQSQWSTEAASQVYTSGIHLVGESIFLRNCNVRNLWGTGASLFAYNKVDIVDCTFDSVGGRVSSNDAYGNALVLSGHDEDASININNCSFIVKYTDSALSRAGINLRGYSNYQNEKGNKVQITNCSINNFEMPLCIQDITGSVSDSWITSISVQNSSIAGNLVFLSNCTNGVTLNIENSSIVFIGYSYSASGFHKGGTNSSVWGAQLFLSNCDIKFSQTANHNRCFAAFGTNVKDKILAQDCTFNNIYDTFAYSISTNFEVNRCNLIFSDSPMLTGQDYWFSINSEVGSFRECTFSYLGSTGNLKLAKPSSQKAPLFYSCKFSGIIPIAEDSYSYFGDTNNSMDVHGMTGVSQANYSYARVTSNGYFEWPSSLFSSLVPLPSDNEIRSGSRLNGSFNREVRSRATRDIYWEYFDLPAATTINYLPYLPDMENVGFTTIPNNRYIVVIGYSSDKVAGDFPYEDGFYYVIVETDELRQPHYLCDLRRTGNASNFLLTANDTDHQVTGDATQAGKIVRAVFPISYRSYFEISERDGNGRNIGELVTSTLPLDDVRLHLLDGSILRSDGHYAQFVEYMENKYLTSKEYNNTGYTVPEGISLPTITSAGVASGFESNKYVVLANPVSVAETVDDVTVHKNFEIDLGKLSFSNITTAQTILSSVGDSSLRVGFASSDRTVFLGSSNMYNPSSPSSPVNIRAGLINANQDYWIKVGYYEDSEDVSHLYIKISEDNWVTSTLVDSASYSGGYAVDPNFSSLDLMVGVSSDINTPSPLLGSYDLSGLKIYVTEGDEQVLYFNGTTAPGFCTEGEWRASHGAYEVCGKYTYTPSTDDTPTLIRLPYVFGFTEGVDPYDLSTDNTATGGVIEAGLPNITGSFMPGDSLAHLTDYDPTGVFGYVDHTENAYNEGGGNPDDGVYRTFTFDASRSSSIYGNSNIVQPQAVRVLYYVVVANSASVAASVSVTPALAYIVGQYENGSSGYIVYSNGYCEQWGISETEFAGGSEDTETVTLLKQYKYTNTNDLKVFYNVQVTKATADWQVYESYGISYSYVSGGQFTIHNNGSVVGYIAWRTCGYLVDGEY